LLREQAKKGRRTLLDAYGATNEAEFFAVATEEFFDQPVALRGQHPELYGLLQAFYLQNPAVRVEDQSDRAGRSSSARAGKIDTQNEEQG